MNTIRDGDILPLELMARREDWQDGISIRMRQLTVGGGAAVADPPVMRKIEPGAYVGEPMLRLGIQQAQQLMDELWKCGLRPTEGTGSAGSLAATERHLKDMRALVFKALPSDMVPPR